MIRVTNHAVLRYQQRVAPVTIEEARQALSTAVIELASKFAGCANCHVSLPTGQRVVVSNGAVITVRPDNRLRRRKRKREIDE